VFPVRKRGGRTFVAKSTIALKRLVLIEIERIFPYSRKQEKSVESERSVAAANFKKRRVLLRSYSACCVLGSISSFFMALELTFDGI